MSIIYGVNGWLELDDPDMDVVENKIAQLIEEHRGDSSWEVCLLHWARAARTPYSLAGYLTFAGDMNIRYGERFEEVIAQICSLEVEISGFFYLRAAEGIHVYIKISRNRIEKIDPAPPLIE